MLSIKEEIKKLINDSKELDKEELKNICPFKKNIKHKELEGQLIQIKKHNTIKTNSYIRFY